MGDDVKEWRMKALDYGTPFTFTYAGELESVAPGQWEIEDAIQMLSYSNYIKSSVVGHPIGHSKSPVLFELFYDKNQIHGHYSRLALDSIESLDRVHAELGLDFVNVTAPFKNQIIDEGPVNLIRYGDTTSYHNTDVLGLKDLMITAGKSKVMIVGSGGAAEAAILAASQLNMATTLTGRNEDKLVKMGGRKDVDLVLWNTLQKAIDESELIVWTVPSAVADKLDLAFSGHHAVIDANYKNSLKDAGRIRDQEYFSGEDWLIAQARPIMQSLGAIPEMTELRSELEVDISATRKPVVLVGLPGSGKTEIGRLLSERLERNWVDMDHEIEGVHGNISDIFGNEGEFRFRAIETNVLRNVIGEESIVSTGGGIVKRHVNRSILKSCYVVWLFVRPEDAASRISEAPRPVLNDDMESSMKKLHKERAALYFDVSDLIVDTTGKSIEETVDRIYEEYHSAF